jgi:uncharacterized membrane protein
MNEKTIVRDIILVLLSLYLIYSGIQTIFTEKELSLSKKFKKSFEIKNKKKFRVVMGLYDLITGILGLVLVPIFSLRSEALLAIAMCLAVVLYSINLYNFNKCLRRRR